VTANATIADQTAAGYLSITPVATTTPATSTLNFPKGDVRANNLTAALGSTGRLAAVYKAGAGATTNLVVDVTGYYVDDASKAGFTATPPTRYLDSRTNLGTTGSFSGRIPKRVALGGVTVGGVTIPNTAIAISGNLTVTNQTRGGFLSVGPTNPGTATPATSNLNFPVGDNRANGLTVRLDADSTSRGIWIDYVPASGTSADHADVILDVTGYFTNDSTKLTFHPLNPGRILDTRFGAVLSGLTGKLLANSAETLAVDGHWGVPAGASAITGNVTVTGQTHAGYVSVTRDPTDTPTTSTVNFPLADNRANGVTAALSAGGDVSMTYASPISGTGTDLILDLSGYFR
jgi:hypothetical protein